MEEPWFTSKIQISESIMSWILLDIVKELRWTDLAARIMNLILLFT